MSGSHAGILGIPVQKINFLFDDLTNNARGYLKKKMETKGCSPSFATISGVHCLSCVDPFSLPVDKTLP